MPVRKPKAKPKPAKPPTASEQRAEIIYWLSETNSLLRQLVFAVERLGFANRPKGPNYPPWKLVSTSMGDDIGGPKK